jgi:hypothetical protein
MQLELFDSGLLPESMRVDRAKQNNMTIYEMVRNPKLYPLESYLDAADTALERDKENLPALIGALSHADSGIRYWAAVGLLLLKKDAAPGTEAVAKALKDESHQVRIMAAWTMVKLGRSEEGLGCLRNLLKDGTTAGRKLYNVLDWMGEDALPLIREYVESKPRKLDKIIARVAAEHGIKRPK